MANEIFVIVENVEMMTHNDYPGQEEIVEVVCAREGYFIDEHSAEKRVQTMNEHFVARMRHEHGQEPTEGFLEEWETHYGYIPLEMNPMNRG